MALTIAQAFRRMGQQTRGWERAFNKQAGHLHILRKLYWLYGLDLKLTCSACPEQYEVYKDGRKVGYYRLRHGEFRVDYPECHKETIYEAEPSGDGMFDDDERMNYMTRAMRVLLQKLKENSI